MEKYKIGYLDEESQWVDKFKRRLKSEFDVYTFKLTADTTVEDVIGQVKAEKLDCLIVDFELKEADIVQFNGNEVIEKLQEQYPFFPVFIITSKDEDEVLGQVEDNDIVRLKDELDTKPAILIHRISNKINSYYNAINESELEVRKLIEKKEREGLSLQEEQQLTQHYMYLDKIDPAAKILPDNLIQPESISKLNEFASDAKQILEELKKLRNA